MKRLSVYVDQHVDSILGPLSAGANVVEPHELLTLREGFKDLMVRGTPEDKELGRAAFDVCDRLINATTQRRFFVQRLRNSISLNGVRSVDSSRMDSLQRDSFMERGILRDWEENAAAHKRAIMASYSQLRGLERR
jgi:hypothetical protein